MAQQAELIRRGTVANAKDQLKGMLAKANTRPVWNYETGSEAEKPVVFTMIRPAFHANGVRSIDLYCVVNGKLVILTERAAMILDLTLDEDAGGVMIGGKGGDKGRDLVFALAEALYGDGYALVQEWV